MLSRHHLPSRQGTSASAAGSSPVRLPVVFYPQIVDLAAIPIGGLTSRLTLAGQPSEAAWIKSQERSATDELR